MLLLQDEDKETHEEDYDDANLVEEAEKDFFEIINAAKQKKEAEEAKRKKEEEAAIEEDEKQDTKKVRKDINSCLATVSVKPSKMYVKQVCFETNLP